MQYHRFSIELTKKKKLQSHLPKNVSVSFEGIAFMFFCKGRTLVLNDCKTLAALPVALINTKPSTREGWAKPKRAKTLAPAPSPRPITYLT